MLGKKKEDRVVVLFDSLGPYHIARLNAASSRMHVTSIEFSKWSPDYYWQRDESDMRFEHHSLFEGGLRKDADWSQLCRKIKDCIAASGASVVAVPGWTRLAIAAASVAAQLRLPCVLMSESSRHDTARGWVGEQFKKLYLKGFRSAMVGGASHKEYLKTLGMPEDAIWQGYDAVDNTHFESGQCEEVAPATSVNGYMLASARFVPKKNLVGLIEAYGRYRSQRLLARQPVWDLVILGDGPLKQEIVRSISDQGLVEAVSLPGFVSYANIPSYYSSAKAFVHVSLSEQWGLVVNEAMAAGCPVIVSKACGCANDIVSEGENGFIVDAQDSIAITSAMKRLHEMEEHARLAMGERSVQLIQSWGLPRFAESLYEASQFAKDRPVMASAPRKILLRILGALCT